MDKLSLSWPEGQTWWTQKADPSDLHPKPGEEGFNTVILHNLPWLTGAYWGFLIPFNGHYNCLVDSLATGMFKEPTNLLICGLIQLWYMYVFVHCKDFNFYMLLGFAALHKVSSQS